MRRARLFVLFLSMFAPVVAMAKPSLLSLCRSASQRDPLGALCRFGADAKSARFECRAPEPIVYCGRFEEWSCIHSLFKEEALPKVTYHAWLEHHGAPIRLGEVIEPSKRAGKIHGVEVQFAVENEDEEKSRVESLSALFGKTPGCVASAKPSERHVFHCDGWDAKVGVFGARERRITVEIAEPAIVALECEPASPDATTN